MSAFGFICRITSFFSLLFGNQNQVLVEFSTPRQIKIDGILLCFSTYQLDLNQNNSLAIRSELTSFIIYSHVNEGGGQFGGSNPISLTDSSFWNSPLWQLDTLEPTIIPEVLSNDKYFARSYIEQRYNRIPIIT
jgi:hypothetical protein